MLLWARTRHLTAHICCIGHAARRASTDTLAGNWPHPVAQSSKLTQLKSTFQAYATSIPPDLLPRNSEGNISAAMKSEVVPSLLAHLQGVEPRTRRASHAMYAWRARLRSPTPTKSGPAYAGTLLCGSSNGGEAGAGERLERLLELSHCEGVIVVVFRWYGGVKLGSDRWKCISTVAKEALEAGGFLARGRDAGEAQEHVRTGPKKRR
ncbi:hypothetical protein C8Q77DRAFT_373994 [Trametes polyzona]|nr:hypothetical protein C8Q77DRAFT_373994 [Trametes polyzona]